MIAERLAVITGNLDAIKVAMHFARKKKHGQNQKVRRTWFTPEGYRIIWRRAIFGVRVPARFQASVRLVIPNYSGLNESFEMWDFVNDRHRLYKTMKAAQEDCERHYARWLQACEATGVRGLQDIFGTIPRGFPLWIKKKINRKAYAVLDGTWATQQEPGA
jgi:hypothetical protein